MFKFISINYKRILSFSLAFLFLFAFTLYVPENPNFIQNSGTLLAKTYKKSAVSNFAITGGVEKKKTETTFDSTRILTGTAVVDTEITIIVSIKKDNTLKEINSYNFIVGQSGIFSQEIDISIGENIVSIEAINGNSESFDAYTINRLNLAIKDKLENSFVLPGEK